MSRSLVLKLTLVSHANRALGTDGIVNVGQKVVFGNILVNRETPLNTTDFGVDANAGFCPSVTTYKEPKDHGYSVVDKVVLTAGATEKFMIRIQTRDMRRPELGDKFSSRHGQKGVVGIIVNQEDMPFNEIGICPDMIMNPHGFPSRMTVGKMIELLAGKAGLMDGKRRFGTAFGGDKVVDCSATLVKAGYSYSG
jgi:DNA-directed RNA polymerase III subunit RPC2